MSEVFKNPGFMGARPFCDKTRAVLLGLPLDCTSSFKPGARFAPGEIRLNSDAVETFSPVLQKTIDEDIFFSDLGDIACVCGNARKNLEIIQATAGEYFKRGIKVVGIGGEHLASLALVQSLIDCIKRDIAVVHFDAHADLRPEYEGEVYSHATVMRQIFQLPHVKRLYQVGVRSLSKEEWDFQKGESDIFFVKDPIELKNYLEKEKNPLYVTVDLDVLDPSVFPGTGTPEPGGLQFMDLMSYLYLLKESNILGADVMELSPGNDHSGISTIAAIKVIRELLLILLWGEI
ncbi:agmatinase [Candidatus Riflebacteria bacterium]